MPEGITPESLLNLAETIADGVSKKKSVSFFQEDESKSVGAQFNRLFGRQNPIYNVLGGGKCRMFFLLMCFFFFWAFTSMVSFIKSHPDIEHAAADVLLWRNKKISAGVLVGATAIWVLFEWLNYNFISLLCFGLIIGMIAQFVWSNASGLLNR